MYQLTTGIGSVSILGWDSVMSLVSLSQRAPSRNNPCTYTPTEAIVYIHSQFNRTIYSELLMQTPWDKVNCPD